MTLLETHGLAIGYPRSWRLDGVQLTIRQGELWALLGPNGCGKSTLVKTLLGTIPALAGTVTRASSGLGYVPQRQWLDDAYPLTAGEVVALAQANTSRDAIRNALAAVSLADLADHAYRDLSGGQKQRVLIARSLVSNPSVVLLDEPKSGLDLVSQREVMELVARLIRERGLGVLLVTHDLSAAASYATHFAVVARLQNHFAAGPAETILASDAFTKAFGRSFAVCHHEQERFIYLPKGSH